MKCRVVNVVERPSQRSVFTVQGSLHDPQGALFRRLCKHVEALRAGASKYGLQSRLRSCFHFCHSLQVLHSSITSIIPMSGILSSPTLSVPALSIETSPSELKVRVGRARSSSIVKVETVGEDSQEEGLDQNLYDNVNAEWVNRKGECSLFAVARRHLSLLWSQTPYPSFRRCMDYTPNSHHCGENRFGYHTRHETGS